jgi:pyruvate dehydrogenase E2 component (dihydrolipoamide acetyltransferase)
MPRVGEFAAIINPPHAATLAVRAVGEEPVVQDGAVVSGSVVSRAEPVLSPAP